MPLFSNVLSCFSMLEAQEIRSALYFEPATKVQNMSKSSHCTQCKFKEYVNKKKTLTIFFCSD